MNICKKLMLAFAGMLLLVLGVGFVGMKTGSSLGDALDEAVHRTAVRMDLVGAMRVRVQEMVGSARGVRLASLENNTAQAQSFRAKYAAAIKRVGEQFGELAPAMVTDSGRQNLETMRRHMSRFDSLAVEYMDLSSRGQYPEAQKVMDGSLLPLVQEMEGVLAAMTKENRAQLAAASSESARLVAAARWWSGTLIVLAFVVGAVVLWVIRGVSRTLREVASDLMEGATQTNSAAAQVSTSSQALAQGASEQASCLEETSASTEEIRAMAAKNAESGRAAADLEADSRTKFVDANTSLDATVQAMQAINTQNVKVSKVLKVIDEIAFQTNILALNAAVEAARAGEAGMGFAVVADEVRTLAQRCAEAARDTEAMIEESRARSREGQSQVDHVAEAVRTITAETDRVKTLVDEVSEGSQQQATAIDQIAKAIGQMEQVTQSAAASAEEGAAAAQQLNAQAESMKAVVQRLYGLVGVDE